MLSRLVGDLFVRVAGQVDAVHEADGVRVARVVKVGSTTLIPKRCHYSTGVVPWANSVFFKYGIGLILRKAIQLDPIFWIGDEIVVCCYRRRI